jgi:transcriptional regulator with XRE-family HTH domain
MGFKENLKSELEFRGMLVKDLAAVSGVNRRTIDNYLSVRDSIPSAEAAVSIGRVLGVSVEYLVTGQNANPDDILSLFSPKVRSLLRISAELDERDMDIVINLAKALSNRRNEPSPDKR